MTPVKLTQTISISSGTMIRFFVIIASVIFLYFVREVVAIFLMALIIASAVDLMTRHLVKFNIPRFLGVIIVYLAFIIALSVVLYFIMPLVVSQIKLLASQFPDILGKITQQGGILQRFGILEDLGNFFNVTASGLWAGSNSVIDVSTKIFGGFITLISIFVISFYLSLQERGIEDLLRLLIPKKYENYIIGLWLRSQRKMGRWLQGQLILGTIVAAASFIGLTLLGINYALFLAVIAGICEIIPIVGPVVSAVPAILVAALQDPYLGLLTLVLYVFIQQMENHLIVPNVLKQATGLNPVIVILSLLAGAKLGGIMGMLLAVPLAAVFVEFLLDVTKTKENLREALE